MNPTADHPGADIDAVAVLSGARIMGDINEIDISLSARDADEDEATYFFSGEDDRLLSYQRNNLLHVPSEFVSTLEPGFYTVTATADDSNKQDRQEVRVLVDRPIETEIALELPEEYGIAASVGGNRYRVSREDPAYVRVTVPRESITPDWDRVDVQYNNLVDPPVGFTVPYRPQEGENPLCYNLPLGENQPATCLLSSYGDDEILNFLQTTQFTFHPFLRNTMPPNEPGILTLDYTINYCGVYDEFSQSARAEVYVADCVPYRDPFHQIPYTPSDNDKYYELRTDPETGEPLRDEEGEYIRDDGLNPFLATHACCNIDSTLKGPEQECFTNPNPGCYGQITDNEGQPLFTSSLQGYILETQIRLCDGERGNICNGLFANTLYHDRLTCGTRGENECERVNRNCNNALAFGYSDTNDDGENEGWCHGTLGCSDFQSGSGGVVYLREPSTVEGSGLYLSGEMNRKATELVLGGLTDSSEWDVNQFPYQDGCTTETEGYYCDGNYDGWFEEVCFSGQCLARESGCSLDESNSWCDNNEETGISRKVFCTAGGTQISDEQCEPGFYCSERSGDPNCVIQECNPSSPPLCYSGELPAAFRQRFEEGIGDEERGLLQGVVVDCDEIGKYSEIAWFGEERTVNGVEVVTAYPCGSDEHDVLVNEGTEDDERWAGRGCEPGDERTSEHEAKDCYAFDGEWEDGVCDERRGTPYCKIN